MEIEDFGALHAAAVAAGEAHYTDPSTGYRVFTEATLQARGKCCGCGCRHCPYNHANVAMKKRARRIKAPAMLHGALEALGDGTVDVLCWSGGKDSFLAARALRREHARAGKASHLLLLTTFDAGSRTVAHQEVPIESVVRQAEALCLPLLGVPLWPHIRYEERMREAFDMLKASGRVFGRVCTGDLHLQHILDWRQAHVAPVASEVLGAAVHAPLWKVPYEALLADLVASGVPCRVCATTGSHNVSVGDMYTPELVKGLGDDVDKFGENGEFHTLAEVWRVSDPFAPSTIL